MNKLLIASAIAGMFPVVRQEATEASAGVAGSVGGAVVDVAGAEVAAKAIEDAKAAAVPAGFKRIKFGFKEKKVDGVKTGVRRAALELNIPVPSLADILSAITADTTGKVGALVEELVQDCVYGQAREQINENEHITQDSLALGKLSITAIANMEKKERRGAGIAKEVWEEFKQDYIDVMTKKTDKPLDKVELAADLFVNRLQKVKTMKDVVAALKDQLAIWFSNTEQKEEFSEVYEFLDGKADTFLKADESDMLKKLGAI